MNAGETAFRCHLTNVHRKLMDLFALFNGIYTRLHRFDLRMLGNANKRRDDLLNCMET